MRFLPAEYRESVEDLERQLMESLKPVQPRAEFVDHLHTRLMTPREMELERRENAVFGLLLVAVSLLAGAFIVWLRRQGRSYST